MLNFKSIKKKSSTQLNESFFKIAGGIIVPTMVVGPILDVVVASIENPILYNIAYFVLLLFSFVLSVGLTKFTLKIARENKVDFKQYLEMKGVLLKSIGICLLTGIITLIGFIFFIIPGIIASIGLSQAVFILIDDNSKSVTQCMSESWELMKGYKWNYCLFTLSFIGWILLTAITFGIAIIWVVPYCEICFTNYYVDLANQKSIA